MLNKLKINSSSYTQRYEIKGKTTIPKSGDKDKGAEIFKLKSLISNFCRKECLYMLEFQKQEECCKPHQRQNVRAADAKQVLR